MLSLVLKGGSLGFQCPGFFSVVGELAVRLGQRKLRLKQRFGISTCFGLVEIHFEQLIFLEQGLHLSWARAISRGSRLAGCARGIL